MPAFRSAENGKKRARTAPPQRAPAPVPAPMTSAPLQKQRTPLKSALKRPAPPAAAAEAVVESSPETVVVRRRKSAAIARVLDSSDDDIDSDYEVKRTAAPVAKKSAKRAAHPAAAASTPTSSAAQRRKSAAVSHVLNSSDDDDDGDSDYEEEKEFEEEQHAAKKTKSAAGSRKKHKPDIHPDYILRKEKLKQERIQELHHSFEDDRGFMLTPLGVPKAKSKPTQTKIKASQLPSVPRKRGSSSNATTVNLDAAERNNYSVELDDDNRYVLPSDDDMAPIADDLTFDTAPPMRRRVSSDATSSEDVEGAEFASAANTKGENSPGRTDNAATTPTAAGDWSFLSASKAASTMAPLSLPPPPLQLPQHGLARMQPNMMFMPSQQQQQPMFMSTPYTQMPSRPIMWPNSMYGVGMTPAAASMPPMMFPSHMAAPTQQPGLLLESLQSRPAPSSPTITSPLPDPRVEEILEDAPF